jgi:hypothetical protein
VPEMRASQKAGPKIFYRASKKLVTGPVTNFLLAL